MAETSSAAKHATQNSDVTHFSEREWFSRNADGFDDYVHIFNSRDTNVDQSHEITFQEKLYTMLAFQFEAILFTEIPANDAVNAETPSRRCFNKLNSLVDFARKHSTPKEVYAVFANCILAALLPHSVNPPHGVPHSFNHNEAGQLICKIVIAIRSLPGYNVVAASRWIRCAIQVILSGFEPTAVADDQFFESNLSLVSSLTKQVILLSRDSYAQLSSSIRVESNNTTIYPPMELEHLSTTIFNLAIDFYVAERDGLAREWAATALEVAEVLEIAATSVGKELEEFQGAGLLAGVLREKMKGLNWTAELTG
ncbi:MAG: hypothetical protein Q9227_000897 [Pyrenula ochraceoflavens]